MQLTLIPTDPDAETTDITVLTNTKDTNLGFALTAWEVKIGKYTGGGRDLKTAANGTVSDVAGWKAVLWCDDEDDEDFDYGEVVTGGEIDDVQQAGQHYKLTLIQTRSSTPDCFNTS